MAHTMRQRLVTLMSQLEWRGINNWEDLDERIQETHLPAAQSWVLQHVDFIPDWPRKREHTPKSAAKEYFTQPQVEHNWQRQICKEMGVCALIAMYRMEQDYDKTG